MKAVPLRASFALLAFAVGATDLGAAQLQPDAQAIARFIDGHRIVLLGEVHDNPAQHTLRAEALALRIADGWRPALAFEQFDTERQPDIDRARRERPRDADHLIAAARSGGGWRWESYRPFVALALDHGLPIVAANLSRRRAIAVATVGWDAVFDERERRELKLDALPREFLGIHEAAIHRGHCERLPPDALPPLARAQIARDLVMAQSLRPHVARGVVLLAGNGHVRNDVGVPFWLTPAERLETVSVGALEEGDAKDAQAPAARYQAWFATAAAERPDPCKDMGPMPSLPAAGTRDKPSG